MPRRHLPSTNQLVRVCFCVWLYANVFVKPNEQNKARFNSAMARKGAMIWNQLFQWS